MIMIQDDPMPTGADKPLRITGDPHKVQVSHWGTVCALDFFVLHSILHTERPLKFVNRISAALFVNVCCVLFWGFLPFFFSASPWTCSQTDPRQGPGRLQSRQSRVWIQNGREQSGCKNVSSVCFYYDDDGVVEKINNRKRKINILSLPRLLCPDLLLASSLAETERWSRRFRTMQVSGSSSNKARSLYSNCQLSWRSVKSKNQPTIYNTTHISTF